ncbi:MAG: cryptochrome/photolyase family protein [Pelagibacterales bacterium]|nr:cryptochrome/photolyase family protein [Pelagibacterales bacterium]
MFLILGDQLFPQKFLQEYKKDFFYMAEDIGLCTQEKYHKHKLMLFLSAMRSYRDELISNNFNVIYNEIDQNKNLSYSAKLEKVIKNQKVKKIITYKVSDHFFDHILKKTCKKLNIELLFIPNPMFLTKQDLKEKFFEKNKKPFMGNFYKLQRSDLNILMKGQDPEGGQWSYDELNRKKLPESISIPKIKRISETHNTQEIKTIISKIFDSHPGSVENFNIPTTRKQALSWLDDFLKNKFFLFGDYEDAISKKGHLLFHSLLSPLLNIGLLTPDEVINKAIKFAKIKNIQINNVEGFVRQIIGWREFIKNVYDYHDSNMKKSNFWGHKLKLKKSWYDGSTGIEPLDHAIKEINKFGYAHHIIRLMLISNIMNLSGIDPKEIYKWFMEMFIDSSDWVMTPNIFGMGTFSDGGIFATKPYICGSNYLLKMSDYKRGEWCEIVDGLYWQFIEKNKKYIKSNHRLSMMGHALEKIDPERKKRIFTQANKFIKDNTY